MQAIRTVFHGPTNTRGSAITARSAGGSSVRVPYDHALNLDENHAAACDALKAKLSWTGPMIGGTYNGDTYWVFVSGAVQVSTEKIMTYKTDFEWSRECGYISDVTDKVLRTDRAELHPAMANFNHDRPCFIRYCEMQRDSATRDGRHDSAQYIQHCLDDLEGQS